MITQYVLQYKLVGFNLPLVKNWLVAVTFHVVFLVNARNWEPLTDFSRIDRRYDLIVTKKSEDLSHQRRKIRNCHWKFFFCIFLLCFSFFVTNTVLAHKKQFFKSYLVSDLYLIYMLNDFQKSNVCCFCYNSFQNWCGSWWQWLFAKRTNPSLLCRVVRGCKIYLGFHVCGTGGNWWCLNNVVILMRIFFPI